MSVRIAGELDGKLARITLARPERLNAFDLPMLRELEERVREAERRRPRAIVIEGEGKAHI